MSRLLIIPLLTAWFGCFWLSRELSVRKRINADWRVCWVFATVAFGSILTLLTEAIGIIHSLNRVTLGLAWILADVILFATAIPLARGRNFKVEPSAFGRLVSFRTWTFDAKLLLGTTAMIVFFLFAVAILTPTTNGDSLSYHLARMAHWIERQSVDHFPTDDTRQLEFAPWSSFAMTNLFLLWGNDRLLNLVQWFAMISSILLLSWLTEQLAAFGETTSRLQTEGSDPSSNHELAAKRQRRIAFTCLLVVTLPIGLVESITTQNDYTTAFWLLCLFALGFLLLKEPTNPWYVAGAGLACGLGVLTKATTYIYACPLVVAAAFWWFGGGPAIQKEPLPTQSGSELQPPLRRDTAFLKFKLTGLFIALFFSMNAPHMVRNYALFGSPFGSSEIIILERNARLSPGGVASNVIRNIALHANSGIPWVTHSINSTLAAVHRFTGKKLNDPETTYENAPFQFLETFFVYDSLASCPLHMLLLFAATILALASPRRNVRLLGYIGLIFSGFVLFCVLLKWQPWHTRIHLAWLLLAAPFTALIVTERSPRWTASMSALLLLIFAGATLAHNSSRPIFKASFRSQPREKQYLVMHDSDLAEPLAQLADKIVRSKVSNVGLKAGFCGIEYPLWIMLRNRGFQGNLFRCYVEHPSARIPTSEAPPDVIVTVVRHPPEAVLKAYPLVENYGRLTALWSDNPSFARYGRSH